MAVIASQNGGRGSTYLLRGFESSLGDAPLQGFELGTHPTHGLGALSLLIGQSLVRVDDEHPYPGLLELTS
jgi:hypothetical protein